MIVITGASGHTGKVIAEALLAPMASGQAAGEKVRVIGRSEAKLAPLVAQGAEAFAGDAADDLAMIKAFTGATAVYVMSPPNYQAENLRAYQEAISDSYALALKQAGVKCVVTLSSVGADKPEKVGPVNGLHALEQKINRIPGINALHLRPGYFMENMLQYTGLIRSMGMTAGALKPELPISMIATRDIAAVAAEALRKRDFTGIHTRELLGPRDYSMKEATAILGAAIGKPGLSYTQLPAMMLKPAMKQMGLSASMAEALLEMMEAMNSSWMKPLEPRSAESTTPTTMEQFAAEVFLPAYQAKAKSA
jgi:uncharacterized protein YbjT (DUF2867 family)